MHLPRTGSCKPRVGGFRGLCVLVMLAGVPVLAADVPPQGIVAYGNSNAYFFLGSGSSGANVDTRSELEVELELLRVADYTLEGTLTSTGTTVKLTLQGPEGTVHSLSTFFGSVPFAEAGTLPAGSYTLHLEATTSTGAAGPIQFDLFGSYDAKLDFGEGGLAGPGGEVPDGDDVPAGEPLAVAKLPGGLVRLDWSLSCRYGDDDYAVYEGPLGDPFGFVPVTCSTGGEPSHEFLPTFDADAFIVVPHDGSSEGSYGDRSDGSERPPSPSACLPPALTDPVCP